MVLKVDMQKVYDMVEWLFMEKMFEAWVLEIVLED